MSFAYVSDFTTYHHFFIRRWGGMYDLLLREQMASNSDASKGKPQILNDSTLKNAFNGIFSGFFRMHLQKYTDITKTRFAGHIKNDEGLKPIDELYKQLNVSEDSIESNSEAKLSKQQRELNALIKEHHEEWVAFLKTAQDFLITTLRANNITVVESEIAEFKLVETRQALRDRLTELKLDPFSETAVLTVRDYLYHKTIVSIRNTFYRQQQPEEISQMKKHLKNLKSTFSQIITDEEALLTAQRTAMATLSLKETA